jgi:hypothetical protein
MATQTKRRITAIVVHHSISHWGDGETIRQWHMNPKRPPKGVAAGNGWKAPGYHAVVTSGYNDYPSWCARDKKPRGPVRVDRIWPEEKIANGCKNANAHSLHVCLIGNFDSDTPLAQQMEKLIDLLAHWVRVYKLAPMHIIGHGEMQRKLGEKYYKTCPGKNVDMDAVRMAVARRFAPKA